MKVRRLTGCLAARRFASNNIVSKVLLGYQPVVRVIEGWNLVVSKVGIVYGEFKK